MRYPSDNYILKQLMNISEVSASSFFVRVSVTRQLKLWMKY